MNYDDVRRAVEEARQALRAADMHADGMARLLCGRLRQVNSEVLKQLKRELHDFNAATGKWKDHQ